VLPATKERMQIYNTYRSKRKINEFQSMTTAMHMFTGDAGHHTTPLQGVREGGCCVFTLPPRFLLLRAAPNRRLATTQCGLRGAWASRRLSVCRKRHPCRHTSAQAPGAKAGIRRQPCHQDRGMFCGRKQYDLTCVAVHFFIDAWTLNVIWLNTRSLHRRFLCSRGEKWANVALRELRVFSSDCATTCLSNWESKPRVFRTENLNYLPFALRFRG
jgi:hypothetical protein